MTLLELKNLHVRFKTRAETVYAVNGVNFQVEENQVLGVIGESGCGKSVTALSIMGLLPSPPADIHQGEILYKGTNLLDLSEKELNRIRGNEIAMIYQDPMEALNPSLKIGFQVMEPLLTHRDISKADARERAIKILNECGLADAERIMGQYPHSLSGGMQQRVMIAMALITEPSLLIADEPTTALDVTIQAQIMDLLDNLRNDFNTSMVFITHDIPVVSGISDRIAVMYAGKVVETATVEQFMENQLHPYTQSLMKSIPKIGDTAEELPIIEGVVPTFDQNPKGCVFASRCPEYLGPECDNETPRLSVPTDAAQGHETACHIYADEYLETVSKPTDQTIAQTEEK
ncbi:ABC transporter ATP-binding protein [Halorubraceae archaeon YAN]|nr:ABC transporter ATP-binding protein [Halorubraceae archaeon YAN]